MKKTIVLLMAAAMLLVMAGCGGLFGGNVTVNYTGTEYDGTLDVYLAIAEGVAADQASLNDLEIVESTKITPSEAEKTHVFTVPKLENYTVFIFHDLNKSGAYDENDTIRLSLDSIIAYLEDDVTVDIDYNY